MRMASCARIGLRFQEVRGDLFKCSRDSSLAHCISEDVRMGKGIATTFKTRFGGVQDLLHQGEVDIEITTWQRLNRRVYTCITIA